MAEPEMCIGPDPCGCQACAPQRYPEFWGEMNNAAATGDDRG